ncbi:MAG: hypothetical protein AAF911_10675 [Planctomycetota bacterium]
MVFYFRVFVAMFIMSVLGCSTTDRPVWMGPEPPSAVIDQNNDYVTHFKYIKDDENDDRDFYLEYYNADKSTERRNEILYDLMSMIDHEYHEYEVNIRYAKGTQEAFFDFTEAALAFSTTVVGGEQAKTVLGAVSLLVQGTEKAFDKAFFRERVVEVVQLEMRKNRAIILKEIFQGMEAGIAEYPLLAGLRDIVRLHHAGSVTRAMQTFAESVNAEKVNAEEEASEARKKMLKING